MKIKIILLCLVFIISACSSKFAYNNLDWLLYWYLDDYVELEGQQKEAFDQKLQTWLSWHRAEELVKYRKQLTDLQIQVEAGKIEQDQWLQIFERGRQHWVRLRGHISPDLMPFAQQLSDKQVEGLFAELAENDQKRFKKWQKKSPKKRAEEDLDDRLDQLKDWLGRLSNEQKQLVKDYQPQFESNYANWMQYRSDIQQAAKQLFEQRNSLPDFESQLLYLLNHPEEYQGEELKRISEHNRQLYAQMSAQLSASLSDKQKKHLVKEIQGLIDDLNDLIADSPA